MSFIVPEVAVHLAQAFGFTGVPRAPLGPYTRSMPRPLWWSCGGDIYQERGTPVGSTRCRATMAHKRQSRPDAGRGCKVKVFKESQVVPSGPVTVGKDHGNMRLEAVRASPFRARHRSSGLDIVTPYPARYESQA